MGKEKTKFRGKREDRRKTDKESAGPYNGTKRFDKSSKPMFSTNLPGQVAPTFQKVHDCIVEKIKTTIPDFADVADAIRLEQAVDFTAREPVCRESQKTDQTAKDKEDRVFEREYNERWKMHLMEIKQYEVGMRGAYTIIKDEYCTRDMQRAIEALPNFQADIYDKPLELLKNIKILSSVPVRATKDWLSLHEHLKLMINIKQREKEDDMEYVQRLRQYRAVVKGFMGTTMFHDFVKNTKTYQDAAAAEQVKLLDAAWEEATALMCFNGASQELMGTTMTNMATEFTSDIDRYPKTVDKVLDLLVVTRDQARRTLANKSRQNNGT